jgi:hypothetical protein
MLNNILEEIIMKNKIIIIVVFMLLIALQSVTGNQQAVSQKESSQISISRVWNVKDLPNIIPDAGYKLVALEIVNQESESTLTVKDVKLFDSNEITYESVGGAAFSLQNLMPFPTFVSGWRIITMGSGESVKIGRDKSEDMITFVLQGTNSKLVLVYIIPVDQKSVSIVLLGSKPIHLMIQS